MGIIYLVLDCGSSGVHRQPCCSVCALADVRCTTSNSHGKPKRLHEELERLPIIRKSRKLVDVMKITVKRHMQELPGYSLNVLQVPPFQP